MKTRRKTSQIWNSISDEDFKNLVLKSQTYSDILKHFGMTNKGGNNKTIKARIKYLDLNDDHIVKGVRSNKGKNLTTIKSHTKIY